MFVARDAVEIVESPILESAATLHRPEMAEWSIALDYESSRG
jgi:hypothetical protein